ncbi:hypothetical protein [Amycolatopsis aidingensis]|uniref:hypothetical protein n=1 Tax=Amycolatopsis aidingensis TaxID=2842453 RepID=UPI001C0B5541|nr:hypothetical protein [Amycolatopsis aidingensis]
MFAAAVPETAEPAGPELRRAQVEAWVRVGGADLLGRMANAVGDLARAAQSGEMLERRDVAIREVQPACVDLREVVRDAENYFPVPHPGVDPAWSELLAGFKTASADCDRAVREGNLELFVSSMSTILETGRSMLRVSDRIQALRTGG